jgi:hypothetical protein
MSDAGGERTESVARRGKTGVRGTAQAPRFVNRIPMRLPASLMHLSQRQAAARLHARHSHERARRPLTTQDVPAGRRHVGSGGAVSPQGSASTSEPSVTPTEKGNRMRKPVISSLSKLSLEEALAYLDAANGDELGAAFSLAVDRNRLDGSNAAPDETEVHHALFLLRRARGLDAPSFDLMRVQLKRRVAA